MDEKYRLVGDAMRLIERIHETNGSASEKKMLKSFEIVCNLADEGLEEIKELIKRLEQEYV